MSNRKHNLAYVQYYYTGTYNTVMTFRSDTVELTESLSRQYPHDFLSSERLLVYSYSKTLPVSQNYNRITYRTRNNNRNNNNRNNTVKCVSFTVLHQNGARKRRLPGVDKTQTNFNIYICIYKYKRALDCGRFENFRKSASGVHKFIARRVPIV